MDHLHQLGSAEILGPDAENPLSIELKLCPPAQLNENLDVQLSLPSLVHPQQIIYYNTTITVEDQDHPTTIAGISENLYLGKFDEDETVSGWIQFDDPDGISADNSVIEMNEENGILEHSWLGNTLEFEFTPHANWAGSQEIQMLIKDVTNSTNGLEIIYSMLFSAVNDPLVTLLTAGNAPSSPLEGYTDTIKYDPEQPEIAAAVLNVNEDNELYISTTLSDADGFMALHQDFSTPANGSVEILSVQYSELEIWSSQTFEDLSLPEGSHPYSNAELAWTTHPANVIQIHQSAGAHTKGDGHFISNMSGNSSSKYAVSNETISVQERTSLMTFTCSWASNTSLGARFIAQVDGQWYGSEQFGMDTEDHGEITGNNIAEWAHQSVQLDGTNWYTSLAGIPDEYAWRDGVQWSTEPLHGLPQGEIENYGIAWLHTSNNHTFALEHFQVLSTPGATHFIEAKYTPNENFNGIDNFSLIHSSIENLDHPVELGAYAVSVNVISMNDEDTDISPTTMAILEDVETEINFTLTDIDGLSNAEAVNIMAQHGSLQDPSPYSGNTGFIDAFSPVNWTHESALNWNGDNTTMTLAAPSQGLSTIEVSCTVIDEGFHSFMWNYDAGLIAPLF